ncbi:MAG: dTDP-4-dehydrorhamnose reductase [Deltaproteobacteria bacterium]|nr:dTDP-4-dehydrorhamnose reductase [Deltaproteobacteria bacterium]
MKVVITGGMGQLGEDCRAVLEKKMQVVSLASTDLDITRVEAVHQLMTDAKPDILLNCAAFTRVDDCESQKERAWQVNAEGPGNLAVASKATGTKLIHISSDYVFDGKKPVPESYTEEDLTNPVSFYGKSKRAGETAVIEESDHYIILRTAWLYGIGGGNFLKTILRLALTDSKRTLRVVNDQFGSPTWSYTLARQIEKLIDTDGRGIYHATAEGYCTWYELAVRFLEKMGVPHAVVPCTTVDYPTPATRPMNSILENRMLNAAGLNLMNPWEADLAEFVSIFKERLIQEASKE